MKTLLLLVLATVLTAHTEAAVLKAASRSNLNLGYVSYGDRLLFRTYVYQPARPNSIQYQDVVYRGNITTTITAIQATELGYTQYASVILVGGGVGLNYTTVRVTSANGYGYYYLVDIWGR